MNSTSEAITRPLITNNNSFKDQQLLVRIPAALNTKTPGISWVFMQASGVTTESKEAAARWIRSSSEYSSLTASKKENYAAHEDQLLQDFQGSLHDAQQQVFGYLHLALSLEYAYLIDKIKDTNINCGSEAWHKIVSFFHTTSEDAQAQALSDGLDLILSSKRHPELLANLPKIIACCNRAGTEPIMPDRLLALLASKQILKYTDSPPLLSSIADHNIQTKQETIHDLNMNIQQRILLQAAGAATGNARHPGAAPSLPSLTGAATSMTEKPPKGTMWNPDKTGWKCRRCLKPTRGTSHTAENCRAPAPHPSSTWKDPIPRSTPGQGAATAQRSLQFAPSTGILPTPAHSATRGHAYLGAAAYGHVPTLHHNPQEAINERGLEAAERGEEVFTYANRVYTNRNGIIEELSVNVNKHYSSASASHLTDSPPSHTGTTAHRPPTILDSGAQRHMGPHTNSPTSPCTAIIQGISGILTHTRSGTLQIATRSLAGTHYTLTLPNSIIHPSLSSTLVSYAQLLQSGYKIFLNTAHPHVVTPEQIIIPLCFHNNLWSFPPPPPAPHTSNPSCPPPKLKQITCLSSLSAPLHNTTPSSQYNHTRSPPPHEATAVLPSPQVSQDDINKARQLHNAWGHPGQARLIRIVKHMQDSDNTRPTTTAVHAFYKLGCTACKTMASKAPPHTTHPPLTTDRGFLPGEFLHLDSVGGYIEELSIEGARDSLTITDDASGVRHCLATPNTTTKQIATLLADYQARSGVPIKKIQSDHPLISGNVKLWCLQQNPPVEFCTSPSNEQISNSRAESTVNYCKTKSRTFRQHSGASCQFHSLSLTWAAMSSNFLPSHSDPHHTMRTPVEIWPDFPYRHRSLRHDLPFGCRAWIHEGKRPGQPDYTRRSRACIFVGWAPSSPAYRLYDIESRQIFEAAANASFDPTVFPLLDMKLVGEAQPGDIALNLDGWRTPADTDISAASDLDLAHWCAGKQIALVLPSRFYPHDAPNTWTIRTVKVDNHTHNSPTSVLGLIVAFSAPPQQAHSPNDRNFHTKARLIPLPVTPHIREAIKFTYPLASRLNDLANDSASRYGLAHHPAVAIPDPTHTPPQPTSAPSSGAKEQPPPTAPVSTRPHTTPSIEPPRRTSARIQTARTAASTRTTPTRTPSRGTHFIQAHHGTIGFTPTTLRAAKRHDSWNLWQDAITAEINGLRTSQVFTEVPRSSVPPSAQILSGMYTFRDKPSGAKARFVILGNHQRNKPSAVDKFAATPGLTSFRLMCSLATEHDDEIDQLDISQAFTQADAFPPDTHIYVNPPEFSNTPPDHVWRLLRPLYGLAIAPAAWANTFKTFILADGWSRIQEEECMYTKVTNTGYRLLLTFYVDDILLSYHRNDSSEATAFKQRLFNRFQGSDEGPITKYLGIEVTRDRTVGTLTLSQEQYCLDTLTRLNMHPQEVNSCDTPLTPGCHLTKSDGPLTPDLPLATQYRDVVGCLQWLAGATRPDLCFAAHFLGRFSSNPGQPHWKEAKHCLRYLCGTASLGITYTQTTDTTSPLHNHLFGFCDSDWATDPDTRKSVGAYIIFLNDGPISWRSKMQPTIALSTTEAEFMAASNTCNEILWLRRLLCSLNIPQVRPTPLYEDNAACIMISEHPSYQGRAKHIDMRLHALRDHVANHLVKLIACPTFDMTADCLTKSLSSPMFKRHRNVLLGLQRHTAPFITALFVRILDTYLTLHQGNLI